MLIYFNHLSNLFVLSLKLKFIQNSASTGSRIRCQERKNLCLYFDCFNRDSLKDFLLLKEKILPALPSARAGGNYLRLHDFIFAGRISRFSPFILTESEQGITCCNWRFHFLFARTWNSVVNVSLEHPKNIWPVDRGNRCRICDIKVH